MILDVIASIAQVGVLLPWILGMLLGGGMLLAIIYGYWACSWACSSALSRG